MTTAVSPETSNDRYLSVRALSAYAGVSVRTIRTCLVHVDRPLPHYRLRGKILVKRSEFDAWITTFRAERPRTIDAIVADVLKGL